MERDRFLIVLEEHGATLYLNGQRLDRFGDEVLAEKAAHVAGRLLERRGRMVEFETVKRGSLEAMLNRPLPFG